MQLSHEAMTIIGQIIIVASIWLGGWLGVTMAIKLDMRQVNAFYNDLSKKKKRNY